MILAVSICGEKIQNVSVIVILNLIINAIFFSIALPLSFGNLHVIIMSNTKDQFDHISKHRVGSRKCDAQRRIVDEPRFLTNLDQFLANLEVFGNTVLSVLCIFSIETKTKEKMEKLKKNRKNLC